MKYKRRLASLLLLIMIFSDTLTSIADVERTKELADGTEVVTEAAVAASDLFDAEMPGGMEVEVEEVTEEEETSRETETVTAMARLRTATPSTPSTPPGGAASGDGWSLDENGCLHLKGKIEYADTPPWFEERMYIQSVIAEPESSINTAQCLFKECDNLKSVDLRNLTVNPTLNMQEAFAFCDELKEIDLSSFQTDVKNLHQAFYACSSLITIYVSEEFDTAYVRGYSQNREVFEDCVNLVGGQGSSYDQYWRSGDNDIEFAIIDEEGDNHGFFTEKTYTVRFLNEDKTPFCDPKTVGHGKPVTNPGEPQPKKGYFFAGWYEEGAENKWNFSDKVTRDLTLTARWLRECTVTFDSNGGSKVDPLIVIEGFTFKKPTDPTKSGYFLDGWYTDSYFPEKWDFETDKVTEDITLIARWSRDSFTVQFDSAGGSEVASQKVARNGLAEKPADPTKDGYIFAGWYTDSSFPEVWDFEKDTVTEDMTLVAHWTAMCTVTFDSAGGTPVPIQKVAPGDKITQPADPTRDGYFFAGWYTNSYFPERWDFENDTVSGDMTLVAEWSRDSFTVRFDSAGGSEVESQKVAPNELVKEPAAPTKNGYVFAGWYKDSYFPEKWDFETDKVTEDITLIAHWDAECTVTFDSAGGTAVPTQKVAPGGKVTKPADPTKSGYFFAGWYTDSYFPEKWDFENDTVSGDLTLVAEWSRDGYTVTFDSVGGSEVPSQKVVPGGKVTKPADPTKAGYAFSGWRTDSYYPEQWDFEKDTVTEDMTLIAQWGDVCTVTFDSAGGSEVPSQQVAPGGKVTKPATPTRSGYTFINWVRINSQSEAVWNFDTDTVAENITLTARWKENSGTEYTVTFDTGGGSSVPSQKVAFNGKATKPANPTRSGYTFAGWYSDPTFAAQYNFDMPIDRDLTIYAKWTKGGNGGGGGGGGVATPNGPGCIGSWTNPVKNGTWSLDGYGYWHYQTTQPFRYTWAYIYDPNAAEGQPAVNCFFFDSSGYMVTGWQHIVDKWYYFNPGPEGVIGALFLGEGTTPEGFVMDRNGAWTGR